MPRNDEEIVGFQPYIATVGDDEYTYTDIDGKAGLKVLTDAEKSKIDKKIKLPDIDGYTSPTPSFNVNYDYIKKNADKGNLDGNEQKGEHPYIYEPKQGTIRIKHTFQMLADLGEYGVRDGDANYIYTSQTGVTGTSVTIKALDGDKIKGYVPEVNVLTTQVPQNSADFEIEMRYNRAIFDVNFDTDGGTDLPGMTLFYGQTIPKLNFDIEKLGSTLQGWKVNKDINYTDKAGTKQTLSKETLITEADFKADGKFQDGIKYAMPAESLTFTAQWTENKTAEYVIQFWTEKPDYDDKDASLPLRERYDFIGARRVDNAETGSKPILTNLDIHGITFPDLNDGRLEKAQNDSNEFDRYYFLNEKLTKVQNASEDDPNVQKSVLSTGETVYNVYYDRRVYTLYFTAANEITDNDPLSYWPTITRDGQVIGKEGNPYKVDVRFNQSLDKIWPKDAEVSNLPDIEGTLGDAGLIGWYINSNEMYSGIFRDTPPYRLSAEDFIDSEDVETLGNGHGDKIPLGENQTKDRDKYEISLGATSYENAIVHHIDFIKDDFDGKEQIDYNLSYWKSDTATYPYDFILPHLQGFTLKKETRVAEWVGTKKVGDIKKTFDELNAERNAKTPFRSDADKIQYIDRFPWSTSKETSPDGTLVDKSFKGKNAYNFANYSRNSYKLKLNNDPKTVKNDNEYGQGNILDVPYEMPLNDLKLDTGHAPKKPDWVPEDWGFLGWALDPAGENLIKKGNETKLHYDQVLYAKWGEPETIWRVKFDPNGGSLRNLSTENISDESKKLEIDGKVHTYPEKVTNEENTFNIVHKMTLKEPQDATKTIIEPTRDGYNFAGWEYVKYTKDANGNDTKTEDTTYKDLYKVPEMYHFGNKVVGNVHLRAIWNKQDLVTVKAIHHFLNADYSEKSNEVQNLYNRRVGSYTTGLGSRQGDKYLLVPQAEWDALYNANADYQTYKDETTRENSYNQILRVEPEEIKNQNTGAMVANPKAKDNRFEFFYRPFKERVYDVNYLDERGKTDVEAFMTQAQDAYKAIKDNNSMTPEEKSTAYKKLLADNKAAFAKIKDKYAIVTSEKVVNGKRYYDARNYRQIPGWVLNDKPQQQLFFDIYEDTDTFAGINETGLDEINFFYKDVRVIEVKDPKDPVPDGYVRVTFKAEKGGSFTDDKYNPVTELYYDVIVELKSDNLPVPELLKEGADKEEGKYYITPDNGKKFTKWDNKALLNKNTIIDNTAKDFYVFTAYFEWSGLTANGMVMTEAYKDPNNTWTNDFAPTIDQLKKQLVWKENDVEKPLPEGTEIKLYDDKGNELTSDEQVYELVKELNKADKEELIRTVNVTAKVNFRDQKTKDEKIKALEEDIKNLNTQLTTAKEELDKLKADKPQDTEKIEEKEKEVQSLEKQISDKTAQIEKIKAGKDTQELDIPITVYKNVYEALTTGEKPLFLSEAEKGELKDITGDYVKVTVNPTGKPGDKDSKIYYVNKNAWVEIPEIKLTDEEKAKLGFTRWTSDNDAVNTDGAYIFEKENVKQRYKFTKDTIIQPDFSKDVVEQDDPNKKPDVPDNFVKVIVTTQEDDIEKATEETKFERTFWVNPTKEVTIPVSDPTGDTAKDDQGNVVTDAAGNEIKWVFKEWSSPLTATFTDKETKINAKYETTVPEPSAEAGLVETYVGREPELDDYEKAIKMMLGESDLSFDKNVSSFEITKDPDVSKPCMSEAKVKVEFNNGQVKEITVPVKVHANIYPGDNNGNKTPDVPEDYVKVTVNPKAYEEYTQQIKVYYVNPKVKVKIPELVIQDSDIERYGFKKWTTNNNIINLLDPEEVYDFTKEYQFTVETEIYAFYEKNGDPEIHIGFEAHEIVKNIGDKVSVQEYKDALIIPKDAEGKDIAEVKGINILDDPDTSKEGYTTAKIQVVYNDGKTEELIVLVKVLPDYVEQTDPDDPTTKPDVPDNFVKVIVDKTENAELQQDEKQIQTFWVNPDKIVTIPVKNPTGKVVNKGDGTKDFTWLFTGWDKELTQQFTDKETTITAQYTKDFGNLPEVKPIPEAKGGFIYTELGRPISDNDYKREITLPDGYSFDTGTTLEMVEKTAPNINRNGRYNVDFWVTYPDGSAQLVEVLVYVGEARPEPQPSEPQIIYRDRIVEKEKIVEKIVKIKDNERLKEPRYMQGYNGKFRPYDGLRRSEAAQILANALKADGYDYDPYYPISYTDVGDTWYTEAVRIVSQAGVFQGYNDGTFKPEGKITRAEWVATLRRFQDLKKVSGNDMGLSIGQLATEEIEAAYQAGWLDVYTSGIANFDANAPITRQEVAAVSNKAFDRVLDKVYLQRNVKNMINYKDINSSMPLYEDILCASNTLLTDGKYYKANTIILDNLTFNIVTDELVIFQKKFQYNVIR
ncbi:S-layer homology domain-containing protein [uncultured Fenollaria sp.]|uniref:S-layer homology domain-containing protein n=1 Tax=uncultured Fenollaria sp. TaxID=1686315 RepID=UPI0025FA3554|nr:S-layer homology domain-containing protein [uncultured Fenollaria sp.]